MRYSVTGLVCLSKHFPHYRVEYLKTAFMDGIRQASVDGRGLLQTTME